MERYVRTQLKCLTTSYKAPRRSNDDEPLLGINKTVMHATPTKGVASCLTIMVICAEQSSLDPGPVLGACTLRISTVSNGYLRLFDAQNHCDSFLHTLTSFLKRRVNIYGTVRVMWNFLSSLGLICFLL